MTVLTRFASAVGRVLGLAPSKSTELADSPCAEEPETLPASKLWGTYVLAVKDVFRNRTVHVAAVRDENGGGEEFRCIGETTGLEAAFVMAQEQGMELALLHGDPRFAFLFFTADGDMIARVELADADFCPRVRDWMHPKVLERHRRITRMARAGIAEQAKRN